MCLPSKIISGDKPVTDLVYSHSMDFIADQRCNLPINLSADRWNDAFDGSVFMLVIIKRGLWPESLQSSATQSDQGQQAVDQSRVVQFSFPNSGCWDPMRCRFAIRKRIRLQGDLPVEKSAVIGFRAISNPSC
jgi:hypothetical protein